MTSKREKIKTAFKDIGLIQYYSQKPNDQNLKMLFAVVPEILNKIEKLGFLRKSALFNIANGVSSYFIDLGHFLEESGNSEKAAECFKVASQVYFSVSKAARFNISREECRMLGSAGNYWNMRAVQTKSKSRFVSVLKSDTLEEISHKKPEQIERKIKISEKDYLMDLPIFDKMDEMKDDIYTKSFEIMKSTIKLELKHEKLVFKYIDETEREKKGFFQADAAIKHEIDLKVFKKEMTFFNLVKTPKPKSLFQKQMEVSKDKIRSTEKF